MYYVAKIVWFVLEPSNVLVLLALGSALAIRPGRIWPRRVCIASALALALIGLSPLGTLLLRPLEERFPPYLPDGTPVAGAIILGGATDPSVTAARGGLALNEAAERVTSILSLARAFPSARIIFTGGSGELTGMMSEADAIEKALPGLAPGLTVEFERASRNTVENAERTRDMVQPRPGERWLLVTSAWHMPRSVGLFRKAGFAVVAYPVDYRTAGNADDMRPFTSVSHGLRRTDLALKEWVGLAFAYLTGKSTALFPAPEGE